MNRKANAFRTALDAHRAEETKEPDGLEPEPSQNSVLVKPNTADVPALTDFRVHESPETQPAERTERQPAESADTRPRMGRPPKGKKSSGEHVQISLLVRLDTSENLDEELFHINRARRRRKEPVLDRSDVIEELLAAWIASRRDERTKV